MEKSRVCRLGTRVLAAYVLVLVSAAFTVSAVEIPDPVIWWDMEAVSNGKIADVRVYNRKLTAQEIQTLARTFGTENFAPAIDGFASEKMTVATKKAKAVATAVFDDGEPTGGRLTYKWSVLSGNAAAASFGDATARETTFTATAVGTYVLQLAVSDGERTSYSAPLTVEVVAAGTIVVIK